MKGFWTEDNQVEWDDIKNWSERQLIDEITDALHELSGDSDLTNMMASLRRKLNLPFKPANLMSRKELADFGVPDNEIIKAEV